jgi:hypothetical protein
VQENRANCITIERKSLVEFMMPQSESRFIKRCVEFQPHSEIKKIPHNTRGLYVLYDEKKRAVYVGIARGGKVGAGNRIRAHAKSKTKKWKYFSVFEFHDNITGEEIREFEGLITHIVRKMPDVFQYNEQRGFKKIRSGKVRKNTFDEWS